MRILLLALVLAAGCAKKPAPQTPANKQDMKDDKGSTDNSKPDDKTDAADPKKSDDPCGG